MSAREIEVGIYCIIGSGRYQHFKWKAEGVHVLVR